MKLLPNLGDLLTNRPNSPLNLNRNAPLPKGPAPLITPGPQVGSTDPIAPGGNVPPGTPPPLSTAPPGPVTVNVNAGGAPPAGKITAALSTAQAQAQVADRPDSPGSTRPPDLILDEPPEPGEVPPEVPRVQPPDTPPVSRTPTDPTAPTTTTPGLQDLLDAFARDFPLGGSDLSDPDIQREASIRFQEIITFLGGDPDLRGSIGDARFVNRLQEFIGKGSTLDQSGIIHIGNGKTLNSLRDLSDFGQPPAAGTEGGGTAAGAFGTAAGALSTTGGGLGLIGGGAGSGINVQSILNAQDRALANSTNPIDIALRKAITDILDAGADIDPNSLLPRLKTEREKLVQFREASLRRLQADLARRGFQLGGPQEATVIGQLEAELGTIFAQSFRGIVDDERNRAQERFLQGITAGTNLRSSERNTATARTGLAINARLGAGQLALGQFSANTQRIAVENSAILQSLALSQDFQKFALRLGFDEAALEATLQAAADGNVSELLQLLIDFLNSVSAGGAPE